MQTIYLDISNKGVAPTIYAKQGDVGRKFSVRLIDSGIPYVIPNGVSAVVGYESYKKDNSGNFGDVIISNNEIEVTIDPNMTATQGEGILCVTLLYENGDEISTWNVPYVVEIKPGTLKIEPNIPSVNLTKAVLFSPQKLTMLQKEQARSNIDAIQGNSRKDIKPSFAWIDDDGKEKVFDHLYPWALANNVPFTSALISCYVDKISGYMKTSQIQDMYKSGMVSFGSHTQTHRNLPELTIEEMETEIANSKTQIEGFGVPCDVMVYPHGQINDDGIGIVRKYFPFGFLAGGNEDENGIPIDNRVNEPPVSTYRLTRVGIGGSLTTENGGIDYLKLQVDNAIATNGLVVFMSHIGSSDDGSGGYLDYSADLAVYTEIINYIRDNGYDIEPVMTVCERFANIMEVGKYSSENPSDYFAVGANGSIRINKSNSHVVMAGNNAYTSATPPSEYPKNQITSCRVSNDSGLPESGGILTAFKVESSAYRIFMPANSNVLYSQIMSRSQDVWLDWEQVNKNVYHQLANNNTNLLPTAKPMNVPTGVNVSVIAKSTYLASLPEGVIGTMTSYRFSDNSSRIKEIWEPYGSVKQYIRIPVNSDEWTDWYVIEPTVYTT